MGKYIVLVFLLLSIFKINAQQLVPDGPCYTYGDELICDDRLLVNLLSQNSESLYWHIKSKSSFRSANIWGVSTLGGLVAGVLLIREGITESDPKPVPLLSGLGLMMLSCVSGSIAILKRVGSANQAKRAIDVFNNSSFGYIEELPLLSLEVGVYNGNVGVVLSF